MERVVVTGGTGYVGRALVRRLSTAGRPVTVLSRAARLPKDLAELPGVVAREWDPSRVGDWCQALEGAGAVVHLAGRKAVGERYTARVKREIFDSRVVSTEVLVSALERV
ncbi:MAG TPA: NAD-dependent epimerase/dehydratase family protein, partial [Dongiaceae bacterium]|nr:NAD-dependent epimerase/dehydratase family protein [Dongiaceae bacterium]